MNLLRHALRLLAALPIAFYFAGPVSAQTAYPDCTRITQVAQCPDEGSAHANARISAQATAPVGLTACFRLKEDRGQFWRVHYGSGSGCGLNGASRDYLKANTCSIRASYSTLFMPPGGSTQCRDGCEARYTSMGADSEGRDHSRVDYTGTFCNGDAQKSDCKAKNPASPAPPVVVWNAALGVCQPVTIECAPGHAFIDGACSVDEGCAVGFILNAQDICVKGPNDCPAGEVKGPDGACLNSDDANKCKAGEAKSKDGTCKKDSDNDGTVDEEEDGDNTDGTKFSGGDGCNVPPTCSGDNILCGQARIQWRIDCNTRRTAGIAGGSCAAVPTCVGEKCKPIEYASLVQQWKTACELEKLNAKSAGATPGPDTATPGTPDYDIEQSTKDAAGADGDRGEDGTGPDGVFTDESKNNNGAGGPPGGTEGGSAGELDDEGFGYARSCPTIPSVNVFGTVVQFNIQPLCDWVSLGGMIVLVLTSLLCLRIMSSSTQV